MRKLMLILLCLIFSQVCSAQFYIGLRDNKFANAGYEWSTGWNIKLEHSIFDESIKYQYIRGYGAYDKQIKKLNIKLSAFFGCTYCNNFYDCGATIVMAYQPLKWFGIEAELNPRYDSEYKYTTCYLVGTSFTVTKEITILGQFCTSPEYRIPEKRFKLGLNLKINRLTITPLISLPIKEHNQNLRVLISFQYNFPSKRTNSL